MSLTGTAGAHRARGHSRLGVVLRRFEPAGMRRTWLIWGTTIGMAAAGAAMHLAWVRGSGQAPGAALSVPWWLLAVGFALSSVFVVHLPVKRDAHSVSLSEVLLIIGLGLASPATLIGGRLAGSAVALTLHRRQPPTKLAFNLSLAYLETVAAAAALHWFLAGASVASPRGWWALMGAAAIAVGVGLSLVTLVIALHDARRPAPHVWQSLAAGGTVSIGAALLGVVYLNLVIADPRTVVLLALLTLLVYGAVRAFGRLAEQHNDLQAVFAFTTGIHRPLDWDEVLNTTLDEARAALRAESADLVLFRDGPADEADRVYKVGGQPAQRQVIDKREAREITRLLLANPDTRVFGPGRGSPALAAYYADLGFRTGIAVPVSGPEGVVAILAVGNRLGPVGAFGADDVRLLEVLAKQASDTMARSRLVGRLHVEMEERARQAADLVRSKDEFLASVSHELRTPLTGVQGCAEVLLEMHEMMEPGEVREMLDHVSRQSKELAELVDDLLVAARADIGSLTIKPVAMDVRAQIDDVLRSISHLEGAEAVDVHSEVGTAFADPLRVRQILRNLLTNALRYGGGHVQVSAGCRDGVWSIQVSDDGPGVPDELREAVFEPYYSAHGIRGVTGSVGLGLTVARQLAEMMNGSLSYRRRLDRTVFDVRLPEEPGIVASVGRGLHARLRSVDSSPVEP